ncbi:MAG: AMP phosphorylase [Desulfurococcales archaeon ex4484_58]|nr:MAG: AMP phosphorylase [Desulfurococcales archaeon ex4484_58]
MSEHIKTRHFLVETIDVDIGRSLVLMNELDAEELGLGANCRVKLIRGDRSRTGIVGITKTVVPRGKILVSPDIAFSLKLTNGEEIGVRPLPMPPSMSALRKRFRGERLSQDELFSLIKDVVEGVYGEAEIAAFIVSQLYYELSEDELYYLIRAMVETGSKIAFEDTVYDEHSIGGVPGNSKVALIAVPTIAAAGLLIPKTSSRAITSPAGTADTMEVLARVDFTAEELKEIAKKVRATLAWGGKLNLAPADDIFVNIERKLGVDPWHQMVASILAKKVAMDVNNLVIDIPVGRKAKVHKMEEADQLAGIFIRQAAKLGMRIKVAVTYGGQPIGLTAGPALEAKEALQTMINRKGRRSLVDKALFIAGLVLELSGKVPPGRGYEVARDIFTSGRTYEKFKQMVEAQEGDPNIKPEDIELGQHQATIESPLEGAVTYIDNAVINMIARAAGAPFDKGAGVYLHAKVGTRVNRGDPLMTIYSNSASRLEEALNIANTYPAIVVEGMLIKVLP